jgi:TolB-like protein/Tfp pilus assembly protein PilF
LGPFRLTGPDGRRIEVVSRRARAIIAMLATARDGERTRPWLQDRLWGDRHPAQARASLRRELSGLRKLLNAGGAAVLIAIHDRVRLDLACIDVDVHGGDDDETAGEGREFLEGLDIDGEDGFEEWLRAQRSAGVTPRVRAAPATRPSIAVLRFEHAADNQDEAYFADGLADEIIAGLARSRLMSVTSRHTSLAHDPRGQTLPSLCADLGVDYVVLGRVRLAGAAARVTVSLANGAENRTIWSERFERSLDDIFAVQDQVTAAIIGALELAVLDHEEIQSRRTDTRNPSHWQLFIRGRWHFWRATLNDWVIARGFLKLALSLEPDDVPSLVMLALCHLGEVWAGVPADPRAEVSAAHELTLRAVALDPTDAYAHSALGIVLSMMGQPEAAVAEQRLAIELNPHLAPAHGELGRMALFEGRLEDAVAHVDRAMSICASDPHAFLWHRTKALAALIDGRPEAAVGHAADARARNPHQFFLHYLTAACHAAAGDLTRAQAALSEGRRLHPQYTLAMMKLGAPFAKPEHLEVYVNALRKAGWEDLSD